MLPLLAQAPRSKHAAITQALSLDIQRGKYRVGDFLPTEAELSAAFGVSRHTVRMALRTLQSLGLVNGRQGVGTTVRSNQLGSRYSQSFSSPADLLQYGNTTKPRIIDRTEVVVDAAMAAVLGCKPGEHWWRVRTLRLAAKGGQPIAYSDILIPLVFGAVIDDVAKSREPIFSLLERRFQEPVVEIRQDLRAVAASEEEARLLDILDDGPALEIMRRFIGKDGRLLGAARTVHPPGSFKYSMDVQLRHSE